jgi:tRNA threonylcarbamoyl adenosine modification protein (Sua5/YciO/YrdC/YwlC family)
MSSPELGEIEAALAAGEVVAVPTDTVYGLAVDPRLPGAVERVFALKKRPELFQLPVLIADPAGFVDLAEATPPALRLISRYWPGPLTVVLPRRAGVGFDLGGDRATIGLRCPASALLRELLGRTGPLAVTSANRHGEAPLHSAGEVRRHFGAGVTAVLDGGRCDGTPSTVISLAGEGVKCLREGALAFAEIALVAAGSEGSG